ncbi:hypothetical protein Tco_0453044 [Tanacetum coccineum]
MSTDKESSAAGTDTRPPMLVESDYDTWKIRIHRKSIAFLQSEKEKILSEKKDLADSYLDEIVCLKNANKVARDMLQRFNMPTQTIPMLSKKPKARTADLHKDLLGTRNPGLGYIAKRAQPVLYDADTLLHPAHHPVRIWDSEDVLVTHVVSMKKMNEKPGHVRPASDFYDKLNALMFVPQKELSGDQVYWLSANEIASQASKPATPATPFVHKSPPPKKDICSIVLTSDIVVPPSSNCLCEDLRSACDREHTKVLELEAEVLKQQKMVIESEKRNSYLQQNHIDLQLKFQNYKQCIDTSSASNAIFEINKLRDQLQGKDTTIRNLDAQINIMKVLNVGSTEGSCDQQALDTDRIQLKDTITSLRIQLDGLKVENVSLQRRYDELSKANTHSRTAYTEKLSALTSENTKLKALVHGKTSSGPSTSEKPKVLASGMYTKSSKYIPPPKRANWVKPTPLPKKKQVTFQEPPRTSNRPTQKPPVQQNKKPNVSVNLSTRTKPATESRKPMPKEHTRNIVSLPVQVVNANSLVTTRKVVGSVKASGENPLDDILTLSKGVLWSDSIAERLTRPTAYKFKTDCSIIPVWKVILWNAEERCVPQGIRGTSLSRAGKPVKKVLLMNLSDQANDDSKYPMEDMLISLLTYLKKSRKFTYKASAQSLKINVFFNKTKLEEGLNQSKLSRFHRYEHVSTKIRLWQSQSEEDSQ